MLPLRDALGEDMVVIDKFVFESGEPIRDEIRKYVSQCRYFVYLISKEAFESDWIEEELAHARDFVDDEKLLFYPIVIDPDIDVNHPRIKSWIRNKYITDGYPRPEVLARLLLRKYKRDKMESDTRQREINGLFLGRESDIAELKNAMIDLRTGMDPVQPNTVIVYGVPHLGRNRLLREFLSREVKSGVNWTEFLHVSLASSDDAWMLAQELNEKMKLFDKTEITEKLSGGEVVSRLSQLIQALEEAKEYFIIEDDGAIVRRDGRLVDWFVELASMPEMSRGVRFNIVSRYAPRPEMFNGFRTVICKKVDELSLSSMTRLFKEYSRIVEFDMTPAQAQNYAERVKGHPAPVQRIVDRLQKGGSRAGEKAFRDAMAAIDKDFQYVVDIIRKDTGAFDTLNLLANVIFLSESNLAEIMGGEVGNHLDLLDSFGLLSYAGPDNMNIALNSGMADYLRHRRSSYFTTELQDKLRDFALRQLRNQPVDEVDLSGYLAGIEQEINQSADSIPATALVPSMVLKVMKEAYYRGENDRVVKMADQLLTGYDKSLFHDMERSVHYWLCLALARKADRRFQTEIKYFDESGRSDSYSYNFLKGFYYRHCGKSEPNYRRALEFYMRAYGISQRRGEEFSIAKLLHEIWLVKTFLKEPDAFRFAKECYEADPKNSYHIEAYFTSLVRSNRPDRDVLRRLINEMACSSAPHRRIITATMNVEYDYAFTHDTQQLVNGIRKVLDDDPDDTYRAYPLRVFKELCERGDMPSVYHSVRKDYPKVREEIISQNPD